MTICAVLNCRNCTNRIGKENGNITYHRFPADPNVKWKWIEATGQKNWFPTKHSRICSLHFEEGSFSKTKKLRRLNRSAIPTIDVLQTLTIDQADADGSDSSSGHEMEEDETEIYMPTSSNKLQVHEERVESHIKTEDLTEAPATPFTNVDPLQTQNDNKYNIMDICRACLASDSTLRPLSGSLSPAYWWICGVNSNNTGANGDKKTVLCVRCRNMLHNVYKFRRQCRIVNKHFAELMEGSQFASGKILDELRNTLKLQNQLPNVSNVTDDTAQVKDEIECTAEVTSRTPEVKTETETPTNDVKTELVADSLPVILSDSDDNNYGDDDDVSLNSDDTVSDDEVLSKTVKTSGKGITKKKVTSKVVCEKTTRPKKAMVTKRKKLIVAKKNGRPPTSVNENLFDKYMDTTVLSFEQQKDIIMQRKECPTYESAPYKCELCHKTYLAKSTYESHVMQHSSVSLFNS